jgi:hypothetical protein
MAQEISCSKGRCVDLNSIQNRLDSVALDNPAGNIELDMIKKMVR